jgi:hypothetical protein
MAPGGEEQAESGDDLLRNTWLRTLTGKKKQNRGMDLPVHSDLPVLPYGFEFYATISIT